MNAAHALANLIDARDALLSCGSRPFLTDGTLLGAVRDGAFMPHDRDVDLGVFAEEAPGRAALLDAMTGYGLAFYKEHGTPERGHEMRFERRGIRVDVFTYYLDGERYHAAWSKGKPIRYGYAPFSLALLDFMGETFLAPSDPVVFLETKYGPEWGTPLTEWDWAWGPRNAVAWRDA